MILDELVAATKKRVDKLYSDNLYDELKSKAYEIAKNEDDDKRFRFEKNLRNKPISFICEVKKASPSKGIIAKDFDYTGIAKEYEKIGASAISVLTEPDYFKGDINYLNEISKNVNLPLLRKDFLIDEIMIYEAKVNNASAILLICAILSDEEIKKYIEIADSLGLSHIVEAHDEEEVLRAKNCGSRVIGVNNRNLKDFTVDINNSLRFRKLVDKDVIFVSESGIKTPKDIKNLVDNNVNAVLVGETFMKAKNKKDMLDYLLSDC